MLSHHHSHNHLIHSTKLVFSHLHIFTSSHRTHFSLFLIINQISLKMLGYLSLLALCASASVFAAPVNEARAADIVGTVHCQLTAEAPLVLRIPSGALLSLDLDGADQALAGLDKPEARAFNFWQCDSPFMGYKFTAGSGGSKAYGHIRPVGEDDNCLTSTSPGTYTHLHFSRQITG